LAAAIKKAKGLEATLIPGHKGVFDVVVDGRLVYSKHKSGRFPEHSEVLDQL
jgi:selenoprotein W-related protein